MMKNASLTDAILHLPSTRLIVKVHGDAALHNILEVFDQFTLRMTAFVRFVDPDTKQEYVYANVRTASYAHLFGEFRKRGFQVVEVVESDPAQRVYRRVREELRTVDAIAVG